MSFLWVFTLLIGRVDNSRNCFITIRVGFTFAPTRRRIGLTFNLCRCVFRFKIDRQLLTDALAKNMTFWNIFMFFPHFQKYCSQRLAHIPSHRLSCTVFFCIRSFYPIHMLISCVYVCYLLLRLTSLSRLWVKSTFYEIIIRIAWLCSLHSARLSKKIVMT